MDLYFERMGRGRPLVLIHGGPGLSHEPFKPTLERAAEFASVVFYDQRGCGKSPQPREGSRWSVASHLADLESLRAALGFENMTLLGHSWGAYLALAYALEHEKRLGKLVLVSPAPPYAEPEESIRRWHGFLTKKMRREIEEITKSALPPDEKANRRLQVTLPLYFHNLVALEEFRRRGISVSGREIDRFAAEAWLDDLRPQLKRLRLPVAIITGAHDRRIPVEVAREIESILYDAHLVVLEDSGHFPFLEQPKKFIEILKGELR